MLEKPSKLRISQEAIDALDHRSDQVGNDVESVIRSVSIRSSQEQPELHKYLEFMMQQYANTDEDLLAFTLGAALTYGILPKSHTSEPLTAGEILALDKTLIEHIVSKERDGATKEVIDLTSFVGKLQKDSPIFSDWLVSMIMEIKGAKGKVNFIMGSACVLMPFYQREEAREMERNLFGGL